MRIHFNTNYLVATMLAILVLGLMPICGLPSQMAVAQIGHPGILDTDHLPTYLRDRGTGIPTSMFATYVRKGEFLLYPFFEYYRDRDTEYAPDEFGFADELDYRGNYQAREALIFIGYGFSDRLAMEFEAAVIDATLDKSPDDPSLMPSKITESGLGDVEGQIRYRWASETERSPGIFSYFETVFPLQKGKKELIGTTAWEYKLGTGIIKGFSWGTLALRVAGEYEQGEGVELGETAFEYIKRLSPSFRVYAGVEGIQDEWEFIGELQWHVAQNIYVKFNNALGLTSKAEDWAPEIGVMFSFPGGGR
jgi:hypothetical protein